jgi:Fic family protein
MYNWQYKKWPHFTYSIEKIHPISIAFAKELGNVNGLMKGLNEELKQETLIEVLISEAIKTSEIEGEYMSREDVMSSIKRNLGLKEDKIVRDKRVAGIAKLMTTIRQNATQELTIEMILNWHEILMEGSPKITPGAWRKGQEPMQVISGAYGKEIVHYEAPPSDRVSNEMEKFVQWFHGNILHVKDEITGALIKAAIAHLYFESIHPFEDGNGRVGRALAEYTLSNELQSPMLLSLSKVIEKNKKQYYEALKLAQSGLDITDWVYYFGQVILSAQRDARELVEFTVKKAKLFDQYKTVLNERQLKVLNRMLENGTQGFEGGMTAKKYMIIAKTSKATATRDLQNLYEIGVFQQIGAGRSVRYELLGE